ncbi:MAG: hypothetical protein C5B58_13085 [Acidobacteria bacterium]|nr:MAG: hypothetical protein C5B58_13085 [Acidobacteriota bacterium]
MPRLMIAPAAAPAFEANTKSPAHHARSARADPYLPPLHHGIPDMFAPLRRLVGAWRVPLDEQLRTLPQPSNRQRDADRDQESDDDRMHYNTRIKLLMAARCEGEPDY